jgi:hypothetical protein
VRWPARFKAFNAGWNRFYNFRPDIEVDMILQLRLQEQPLSAYGIFCA